MKIFTAILSTILTLVPCSLDGADAGPGYQILERRALIVKAKTQLHFPFLLEHENGNWYMTYREGKHGAKDGDRVQCVMSEDQGRTWKPWAGLEVEKLLRFFRTRLSDGAWISHRYTLLTKKKRNGKGIIMRSKDGVKWSKETVPFNGLTFAKYSSLWGHIIETRDKRLLCGIYGWPHDMKNWSHKKYKQGLVESKDGGKTWNYLTDIVRKPMGWDGPCEADLCELKSGELIAMSRTSGWTRKGNMVMSRSKDGGKTWSEPVDMGICGVSPQLMLLKNGALVCTFGSRDVHMIIDPSGSGEKWSKPIPIYKGQGTGYTDLQALSDDTFRMVYDESAFKKPTKDHKIMRVVVKVKGV